jgi:hypothetical protein
VSSPASAHLDARANEPTRLEQTRIRDMMRIDFSLTAPRARDNSNLTVVK